MQGSVSIIIPAYNEERTVGNVLSNTISVMDGLAVPYEIIVVDDGSTDDTKEIALRHTATVLSNRKNQGKGCALRKGFRHACGDILITADADGAHQPRDIPRLMLPLFNGADIVAGSRFLSYEGKNSTSSLNFLGNFLFNTLIMILTGKRITDSQTGFRAFKRTFLEMTSLESVGYEIETEMTVKGLNNGFSYHEEPIDCRRRMFNASKLNILSDGLKILKTILKSNFNSAHTTRRR